MATFEQVKSGISKYLDFEVLPKIQGWQKWVIGAGCSMYLEKGVSVFNELKENPMIQKLELINSENKIDIDTLYRFLSAEAKKSAITFKSKMMGDITLNAKDVEKLYTYIKEFEV